MKKSLLLISMIAMVLLLSGCVKLYKDVKSDEYATLQMVTKGESFSRNDVYSVNIYDYSKGCKDMQELGLVYATGAGPTDIVKLPVDEPLLLKIRYTVYRGTHEFIDYINIVLKPENGKHYVVKYIKEEINDKTNTEYDFYMQVGEKALQIPNTRIRELNNRECM